MDMEEVADEFAETIDKLEEELEALKAENEKLTKALEIYARERARFKHNYPEISGVFFLAGGHGTEDDNMLPEFIEISPAYGCGWTQIYKKTEQTIMYEGS